MNVIGFTGKARHGKDTCAKIVAERLREEGKVVAHWAFAHPLKAQVYAEESGRIPFEHLWEDKPPEVRRLLQLRGTEQGRDVMGPYLWVLNVEAQLRLFEEAIGVDTVVISDVRFPEEIDFINDGGIATYPRTVQVWHRKMLDEGFDSRYDDFDKFLDAIPKDKRSDYLDLEVEMWDLAQGEVSDLRRPGFLAVISSDRETLTGEAGKHSSETLLDKLLAKLEDPFVVTNNKDTTLEELSDQLTPIVQWALSN